MVLIKVGELVIEVNIWANIVGNAELKGADGGVGDVDRAVWRSHRVLHLTPLGARKVGRLE